MQMPWYFPLALLSLLAGSPTGQMPATSSGSAEQPVAVRGFLDAHWEFPNFLPDNLPGQTALPFQFDAKYGREAYFALFAAGAREHPDGTTCIRVVGEGYVSARTPTNMWPATKQFVFTKIDRLEAMSSDVECKSRL